MAECVYHEQDGVAWLDYPEGHPQRVYAEKTNAEYAAKGEPYRMQMPRHYIPPRGKRGGANARDVVGRFLEHRPGASGQFQTNGCTIWSYGYHWIMVKWNDKGEIEYDVNMFRKPYSNETSGHMSAVEHDPRLWGRVVNEGKFPKMLEDEVVQAIVSGTFNRLTMREFDSRVGDVAPMWSRPEIMRRCFTRARTAMHKKFVEQRSINRQNVALWRKHYTKRTVDAHLAFYREHEGFYVALIGEYEKRFFKGHNEKMPPIPIRSAPVPPALLPIPPKPIKPLKHEKAILGWHFLPTDRRLRHEREPREVIVGTILENALDERHGQIELCNYGLHASQRILQAVQYYRGGWLCRTAQWGHFVEGGDKIAAQFREVLGMIPVDAPGCEHIRRLLYDNNVEIETQALRYLGMTATQRTVSVKQAGLTGEQLDAMMEGK